MQISANGIPRREQNELLTPAEKALREAAHAIDRIHQRASQPLLFDAHVLVVEALGKVADWVELSASPSDGR